MTKNLKNEIVEWFGVNGHGVFFNSYKSPDQFAISEVAKKETTLNGDYSNQGDTEDVFVVFKATKGSEILYIKVYGVADSYGEKTYKGFQIVNPVTKTIIEFE